MSKTFKWNMLITSFLPLWISILIIVAWDIYTSKCPIPWRNFSIMWVEVLLASIIIVIMTVSILGFFRFLRIKSRANENSGIGTIISAKRSNKLASDFLLSYVLPMVAFDYTKIDGIILFIIYFSVLAFISLRNNNVYTNILFEFKGFKIYECDVECKIAGVIHIYRDCFVISKDNLISKIGHDISYFDFDNDIYIDLTQVTGEVT